jgi:hypothetical protein
VACVDDYQRVSDQIEGVREHWADRAIRIDDPAAMAKLAAIEKRLNAILVGRDRFTTGSVWAGQLHSDNGAFQLTLTVEDCTGNDFRGELAQRGNIGRQSLMAVVGSFEGNRIAFHTTQMNRGKNRAFEFRGYLLSDRIVTDFQGISVIGNPVSGWVSLWLDNGYQPNRRRPR